MLHIYHSNKLEVLLTVLAEQSKHQNKHPFEKDVILVQSPGMSQWLKLELATRNGIAANIDFPLPSSYIWSLYQKLLEDVPKTSPFNKDRLVWRIHRILPKFFEDADFAPVVNYLNSFKNSAISDEFQDIKNQQQELSLYKLALKIADVYDNYLMYRFEWLNHWSEGHNTLPSSMYDDDIQGQQWQAKLWRALETDIVQSAQSNNQFSALSRAQLHEQLMNALAKLNDTQKTKLPKSLTIFGISTIPSAQLDVFNALSDHIDVNIYWLNPCSEFWGDIVSEKQRSRIQSKLTYQQLIEEQPSYFVSGNPLLASWGKVGKDHLENLHLLNAEHTELFVQTESNSLLHNIQNDVLTLSFKQSQQPLTAEQLTSSFGVRTIELKDDSITLHSCHTRIRELEVLKDRLLHWFQQDETLRPKDIIVMMPNIDDYAPHIHAIFGQRRSDVRTNSDFIPYTVADRAGVKENPIFTVFVNLLNLPKSRFTVVELLDVLDVPTIMNKFQISEIELELIRRWLVDCRIRWSKHGKHKAQWGLPDSELNTWLHGLKRLILGVAMSNNETWHDVLSYSEVEGMQAEVVGKLLDYFSFMSELDNNLQQTKSLGEWSAWLTQFINELFSDDLSRGENTATIQKLISVCEHLNEYAEQGDMTKKVSTFVVANYFEQALSESGVTQRFLAGNVNFCTLMPMRSVPFKVVCVLGLNEGDYPKYVEPISFDLVAKNKSRKGDRSRKLDDRYLFLEALISARDKLHLSYIGQSDKNNQQRMPSILVSELLDYCQLSFKVDQLADQNSGDKCLLDHVLISHPLQPFNTKYFAKETTSGITKSYSKQWFEVANKLSDLRVKQTQSELKNQFDKFQNPSVAANCDQKNNVPQLSDQKDRAMIDVEINDFLSFFSNPVRYFYRNVLGVNLSLQEDNLIETEVFSHDGLERFQILNKRLQNQLNGKQPTQEHAKLSGMYPDKKWGQVLDSQYDEQVQSVSNILKEIVPHEAKNRTHTIKSLSIEDKYVLSGLQLTQYDPVSNSEFNIKVRFGDLRGEDIVDLYLAHLILSANQNDVWTACLDKSKKLSWFEPLNSEQAKTILLSWLDLYKRHKHSLFNWHPRIAVNTAGLESNTLIHKEITDLLSTDSFGRNLSSDPYVVKVLRSADDVTSEFMEINRIIIQPMMDSLLKQGRKAKISWSNGKWV